MIRLNTNHLTIGNRRNKVNKTNNSRNNNNNSINNKNNNSQPPEWQLPYKKRAVLNRLSLYQNHRTIRSHYRKRAQLASQTPCLRPGHQFNKKWRLDPLSVSRLINAATKLIICRSLVVNQNSVEQNKKTKSKLLGPKPAHQPTMDDKVKKTVQPLPPQPAQSQAKPRPLPRGSSIEKPPSPKHRQQPALPVTAKTAAPVQQQQRKQLPPLPPTQMQRFAFLNQTSVPVTSAFIVVPRRLRQSLIKATSRHQ